MYIHDGVEIYIGRNILPLQMQFYAIMAVLPAYRYLLHGCPLVLWSLHLPDFGHHPPRACRSFPLSSGAISRRSVKA
jgi:hypothetical protein